MASRSGGIVVGSLLSRMAKKILLINGGGAFGFIPAYFLSLIKDATGKDFRESIDCLSGSSVGGVLSAIYSVGNDPKTVSNAFLPACEEIFSKRFVARINPLASPTYSDSKLKDFIHEYVGNNQICDIRTKYPHLDTFFAGLNVTDDSFKVWDNITGRDDSAFLKDVCRITCAAPTYFDAFDADGKAMVDCGLIENTMIMTTTIGYKNARKVPFEEMDVLLIGTGFLQDKEPLTAKRYNSLNQLGILYNLIIPYVTQSNELASIYWARGLGLRNFYYFNPVVIDCAMDAMERILPKKLDAMKQADRFLAVWHRFMSDEKLDPYKEVRDLIVLPENISEGYYARELSKCV